MQTLYSYAMNYWLLPIVILISISCDNPIEQAMSSKSLLISTVKKDLKKYELQILFTQIDSTDQGGITFTDYAYQVDDTSYFYPASTVKLPIALFAAEYVDAHEKLSIDIPYLTSRDQALHTIGDDYRQIFAVSDNESYNRLYEIVGRDYVNNRFKDLNLSQPSSQIRHRLATDNAAQAMRSELKFFPSYVDKTIVITPQKDGPIRPLSLVKVTKGRGFIENGVLVNQPMDFSKKNYFPLEAQHQLMKRLFFPASFKEEERFKIKEETRSRIIQAMKTLPRKARYNQEDYHDSYAKFFIYGDTQCSIPSHVEIYNKVGYAFGTLTETAFIKDSTTNVKFILSATLLVNNNGIFNDNIYEYETVGIPFLAQLGREFYAQEKRRMEE